ncbi:MAG: OB-fold nucleic acid binding domain-containing protein, partial [Candidatus Paceibacterota bacterium]
LNGSGMTKWLKELRPTAIHDINAMVALYRPGPMQFIPDYIARKHNPHLIKYLDPSLKSILEQSYGVLVYQDDLLIMAHDLAGYSWGEVDKFRKAVGKKIPKLMAEQREKFIKGCIEHSGWKKEKAEEIWAWLEPFAAYGFNKAHSASYGRVAYQTAYLKANYPSEYMTAVLSAESGDVEKIAVIIGECKRMGIPVLPPDINESFGDFTVIKNAQDPNLSEKAKKLATKNPDPIDKIRFGLFTIKNLGTEIAKFIVAERKKNGLYLDLGDFLTRIKHKNLNKKSLEALAKAGALDSLGESRGKILANLEEILSFNREETKSNVNQTSLFGLMTNNAPRLTLKLREAEPIEPRLKLAWEKELLGLYVSGHPLDNHREKFNKKENTICYLKNKAEGFPVITGGIIGEIRVIFTKNNKQMAFFKLLDFNDMIECVAFPDVFEKYKNLLVEDKCVALKGKLNHRNGDPSVLMEAIKEL